MERPRRARRLRVSRWGQRAFRHLMPPATLPHRLRDCLSPTVTSRPRAASVSFKRFSEFLPALDGADAGDAAQAKHHAVEVAQVFSFHYKFDEGFPVFGLTGINAADVGVVVGDDCGQLLQHAGAVIAEDRDFDGVTLGSARNLITHARPLDGDAAVAL